MGAGRVEQIDGHVLLRFADTALETSYRDYLYASNRSLVTLSLALAALLFAVAEPLARAFFPSDIAALDNALRWYLNLPVVLLALMAHLFMASASNRLLVLTASLGLILAGNAALLWSAPYSGQLYYAVASVQIALFGFFLLGIRFRPACLVVLTCFAVPATGAVLRTLLTEPPALLQSAYAAALLIVAGLAFAAFALDRSRRELFLANLARDEEHARRLTLEEERNRWLQVSSDYLNHEMKNALLGISSSLNLMKQRSTDAALADYIDRAASSTGFMKRLLAEVSASTSLESALDELNVNAIDLGGLMLNRLEEYRAMYPGSVFEASIVTPVEVPCDVERLVQAFDKLVDNAVQHSTGEHPIEMDLSVDGDAAVLSITNRGDPLDATGADIFAAHVSGRQRTGDSGYGLGLYIVQRIVEAHGGSVSSEALNEPDGARFTLRLPLRRR